MLNIHPGELRNASRIYHERRKINNHQIISTQKLCFCARDQKEQPHIENGECKSHRSFGPGGCWNYPPTQEEKEHWMCVQFAYFFKINAIKLKAKKRTRQVVQGWSKAFNTKKQAQTNRWIDIYEMFNNPKTRIPHIKQSVLDVVYYCDNSEYYNDTERNSAWILFLNVTLKVLKSLKL